ncbi:alkaline shock response membrane anchor protein AmaP [Streptomyces sp. LX-29]|uniref:alkaline shock response membrane anchor protein AmaP n=1 Tax=Streptomyces sp. LX-29 TaxID=2900152 RepID=UPI00240D035F|nr:alkaline shock response membrane anchor protein AmaP [Streptomyces sp. LX-29]WFB10200.1 alkaline shock response membrane anchor protein AmaP [Streptomyces sp. LX-29]
MLRTVNRVLVGLVGLALVLLGGAVLVAGLDLRRRWGIGEDWWWPFAGPHDVLLSRADRIRWRDEGWWWPAVIGCLGVVLLLALWWLLAQLRRRQLGEVLVGADDIEAGAAAVVRGRALEAVMAADAESLDGVERARVTLRGRRTAPEARMALVLAARAQPVRALEQVRGEVLEHARSSVGLARFPTEVRVRAVRHGAERVS